MTTFYEYFNENMEALGLPAPKAFYGTPALVAASLKEILLTIDKLGKAATVAEVVGASTAIELLGVGVALTASAYVGCVIGSLAVATAKTIDDSLSASQVVFTARRFGVYRPWLDVVLRKSPQMYGAAGYAQSKVVFRKVYA